MFLFQNCYLVIGLICWCSASVQITFHKHRLRRFEDGNPTTARPNLRERVSNRFLRHRQRTTTRVCYDLVGCFEVPHSRSPLQKSPEAPGALDTKFYLFRRSLNFSEPNIIFYDDKGASLGNSVFDPKLPLKVYIHGYMSRWNEKGAFIAADAHLKLTGRRGRLPGPRGDSRSVCPPGVQGPQVRPVEQSRLSAAPFPPPPRSLVSAPRGPVPPVPSHQTLGPSSVNKGPYRPLSPRVGPPVAAPGLKPRQVIVSSPGSPSSSSDSQSGSDSVKHCLPSRVSSPAIRASPSRNSPTIRNSPSVTNGIHNSPTSTSITTNSTGPRNSPSVTSLSRASPSILQSTTRSSSPAMQGSSAGMAVTLTSGTSALSTLSGLQSTISNISTTANNLYSLNYTQPTTYASTNPFLTGAYMNYNPELSYSNDKYNTISSSKPFAFDNGKEVKFSYETKDKPFSFDNGKDLNQFAYDSGKEKQFAYDNGKEKPFSYDNGKDKQYSYDNGKEKPFSLEQKSYAYSDPYQESKYDYNESKYSTLGSKSSYLGYSDLNKYSPNKDTSPGLLGVEETPTPTSSIETEDSHTREILERDVDGDGEQSD